MSGLAVRELPAELTVVLALCSARPSGRCGRRRGLLASFGRPSRSCPRSACPCPASGSAWPSRERLAELGAVGAAGCWRRASLLRPVQEPPALGRGPV